MESDAASMARVGERSRSLVVRSFQTRREMGKAAAADIGEEIRNRLATRRRVRMIFAAAPSQSDMLEALVAEPGIDWPRVEAFHLDEYIGLDLASEARFARWLKVRLFDLVPLRAVPIRPEPDPAAEARAYAVKLDAAPIDIVCLGIGVNGHLAFNDPPVADFADPLDVKIVELDPTCRKQQVDDAVFARLRDVPTHALTLTIPRLMRADRLFCVVPGEMKREAVMRTLTGPIGEACPASILRRHPDCTLYLDAGSNPHV